MKRSFEQSVFEVPCRNLLQAAVSPVSQAKECSSLHSMLFLDHKRTLRFNLNLSGHSDFQWPPCFLSWSNSCHFSSPPHSTSAFLGTHYPTAILWGWGHSTFQSRAKVRKMSHMPEEPEKTGSNQSMYSFKEMTFNNISLSPLGKQNDMQEQCRKWSCCKTNLFIYSVIRWTLTLNYIVSSRPVCETLYKNKNQKQTNKKKT